MENINFSHVSVLLNECIEALNIKPDGIYIDRSEEHTSELQSP